MRLGRFIVANLPEILSEWDAFARTLDTAMPMSDRALRDHAKPILEAIALDMATPETAAEQFDKSRGLDEVDAGSAASTHGTLRHTSGFSLTQLTAEYRALRATVLRLWLPQVAVFDADVAMDMVRFNETIDQALAESAMTFSDQGARTRDTFLAILGHDLRSPLAAISMAGEVLSQQRPSPAEVQRIGLRLCRSAGAMTTMVNDLIEFARLQLGGPMPLSPVHADLADLFIDAVEEARAAHPEVGFDLKIDGDLGCNADGPRLRQVFSNLLNNAAQYGLAGLPVQLSAHGSVDAVAVEVRNTGPVIPEAALGSIFESMVQLQANEGDRSRPSTSMGLGLYIAREIVLAHGGSIEATSSDGAGTSFHVRIPKSLSAQELGRLRNDRS
jgi:signal transduction histidine kinase